MNADCVFCKIIAGEIPSVKLLETERCLAFMDIGPIVKGHALVIPRKHVERLEDLPADLLCEVMQEVQRVVGAAVRAFAADGVNLHQANGEAAGQVVPHVHFHVIPRFDNDGHSWNWNAGSYDKPEDMQQMGDRIRAELNAPN